MTLADTGPLVALINRNDPNHTVCVAAARQLPAGPLLTTWPCFTEAMYLLHRAGGHPAQVALWQLGATGWLKLHDLTAPETDRVAELMDKYRDKPMDMADASLVALAESMRQRRVFSLDSDFHIYRLADGSTLDLVP